MATAYADIIKRFLPTISEYKLLEVDEDTAYELVTPYVVAAITQFRDAGVEKLDDRDDEAGTFNIDLTSEEMDIICDLMRVEWLKQKLYNSELQRNSMSTKDYTVFSPANLQNAMRDTYTDAREEARMRLYQYTYTQVDAKYKPSAKKE